MSIFFGILFLITLACFVIGFIQPQRLWLKSRKQVIAILGGSTLVFFALFLITILSAPQAQPAPVPSPTPPAPAPVITATTTSTSTPVVVGPDPTKKVIALLTDTTQSYVALFATAKKTLGTTQYNNAQEGLQAMDDSNSAAVRFGAFRTDTCLKNDPGQTAMAAYKTASNLYSDAHRNSPGALDDWNYDLNMLATHLCEWAGDGVDWQINKISDEQLQADQDKVDADFATVRKDIRAMSK